MTSATILDLPSSPPSLASLCLGKVWLEDLPVTELPLTLQEELLLLSGGQFVKKNSGTPIFSIFWHNRELTVLKHHDGFKLFQEGVCLLDMRVGERRSFTSGERSREKAWVEVGGVYRCVEQLETGYNEVRKMGWKMVFTRTGMTLTFEKETVLNGSASFYHEEWSLRRKFKLKEME
jgi:hypothetical protein